ncbi:replication initiation and membrane attachment family protein [Marininema halotolerans]|nr:DnaD domain protein [Marininema halotolerans]
MSMTWRDCTPQDGWSVRSCRPLSIADMIALTRLYQPIIGTQATSLYTTYYCYLPLHQAGTSRLMNHLDLMKGLSLSLEEVVEARYLLEGVGLLNTYRYTENGKRVLKYELIPPLTPLRFFQSDVLSVALYNRIGKEGFQLLRNDLLSPSLNNDKQGVEVTKSFGEVFGSLSPTEIASATELNQEHAFLRPAEEQESIEGRRPAFNREEDDLTMVRSRLADRLDDGAWTVAVENCLREIRFLYQLDDWDLIKALQNPYVTQGGRIDIPRFRSFVRSQYRMRFGSAPVVIGRKQLSSMTVEQPEPPGSVPLPQEKEETTKKEQKASGQTEEEERHFRALNQLSPIKLLSHFQKGKQIPRSDLELVEDLASQYGLTNGVINVLLEYVLYTYDYKLPRPLVEKIAGHWQRKNIDTVEDAREMVRKELNWEWNKRNNGENKRRQGTTSPWKKRRMAEEKLPKAIARSQKQKQTSSSSAQVWEVDPEAAAQLQAEIEKMEQSFAERDKQKGNA